MPDDLSAPTSIILRIQMKRFSRLAAAILLLNLSLTGSEVVCEHEESAAASLASHDHGLTADAAPMPSDDENTQCDESEAMCCNAIASCSVSGVPERINPPLARMHFPESVVAAIAVLPDNAPLEVATPPPRRGRTT